EECEWKPYEEDEILEGLTVKVKIEDEKKDKEKEDLKGIPEFWLTENDKPTLKHLQGTQVKFLGTGQPMYFVFRFHFEPNEYFTSEVLTKTHNMRSEPDDSDPLSFDGPEIMGYTRCYVDWKRLDKDEERGEEGDEENDPDYDSEKDQNPAKGKQL
ncbi:hypothetical protein FD755_020052, partial [Muntiacus reevesi]